MPTSQSQAITLTCGTCKQNFFHELWTIIDIIEKPNLFDRIKDGSIHAVKCPHCGAESMLDAPLLVFQPDKAPHIIFVPATQANQEQNQEMARHLIKILQSATGTIWQDEWLEVGVPGLSLSLVTIAIQEGTETAIQFMKETKRLPPFPPQFFREVQAAQQAVQEYHKTGQLSSLEQAVKNWEEILEAHAFRNASPDFQLAVMCNAGGVLSERFWALGEIKDLEKALRWTQQAINLYPKDSPNKTKLIHNLGTMLITRYKYTGELRDLEHAIQYAQQAVDLTPENSPDKVMFLTSFGTILSDHYKHCGDLHSLELAIQAIQRASELTPKNSIEKAGILNNLGTMLSDRYTLYGDLQDLEQAIQAAKQAVNLTPNESPNKAMFLSNLGNRLSDHYDRSGNFQDLEQAIQCAQQAVNLTPKDSPETARHLISLGTKLADRYNQSGELLDLDQAILCAQQAVDLTPTDSPDKAGILNNLGRMLAIRHKRSGNLQDLEQAIQCAQQAVNLTPKDSPSRVIHITSLGNNLSNRYDRLGNLKDLEQAIQLAQQAAELTPEDSPHKAGRFNNLVGVLLDRYDRTGDLYDLDQAILCAQQAVDLTPESSPDKATHLSSLGVILYRAYYRTDNIQDLEQAIEATQQAFDLTPKGSPQKITYLNSLGTMLSTRYKRSGDPKDLEHAVQYVQRTVDLTSEDSPSKAGRINNLGAILSDRYNHSNQLHDLEQAIQAAKQAVELTPDYSPNKASFLTNLGNRLADRYRRLSKFEDLESGKMAYDQSIILNQGVDIDALTKSSLAWGNWALERHSWEESANAFRPGLQAIDTLVHQHALRTSKEAWLKEAQGIPERYAFALAKIEKLEEALEVIETGRARLLSEQLSLGNIDLQALKKHKPDLYHRYQELTNQVHKWQSEELQQNENIGTVRHELRCINKQLEQLAEQIQHVDGFEHFLAPVRLTNICQAAQEYPIAYIAATPAGGMALLALPKGKTKILWFDELTHDRLLEQMLGAQHTTGLGGYLGAYQNWKISLDLDRRASEADKLLAFNNWLKALDDTTQWMWNIFVGELTGWLSDQGYTHCTLVPTGLLTLLPLHAAWREDDSTPTGRRYALDKISFSYAPNALALLACQKKANRPTDNILVIENPNHDIRFSQEMGKAAIEYFNKTESIHFPGDAAKRDDVLDALPVVSTILFWTHGLSNPLHPLESSLLMANEEKLTLREILPKDLPKARLAILSACETGMVGLRNIDEVVSLPTGLIQAGVPGVIGSMWTVETISTLMLMLKFFDLWKAGQGLPPQEAFRQAQQWLRDTTNKEKEIYFEAWKQKSEQGSSLLMPDTAAETAYLEMMIKNPEERSFSHPFFWAAFGYFGI